MENTIRAFDAAVPVSDMLEMDVCLTLDRVLVVHHDRDLLRTCGLDRTVGDVLL